MKIEHITDEQIIKEIQRIFEDIDKGKYKALKSLDSHLPQKHIDDFLDKKYD